MESISSIGHATGTAGTILRAEGLAVFVTATFGFFVDGGQWWLYLALFLLPDSSFAGYLAGPRIGAAIYNLAHSYVLPLLMALAAWWLNLDWAVHAALIWLGHIGFDRMLGYGLKHPTHFTHTHLGPIGKARELL